ncbi:MSCRAMM family protein [Eggerthia catenaformis]
MKQMIKKGFAVFMTVLMTMGMLMNNAFAANDFKKVQLGSKSKYSYGGAEHGTVLYMTKAGEEVYCLEYNKSPANSYSKQDPNFLSQKSKEDLGLINYYVHQDYSGKDAYAITQSLVWRYRAGSVKSFIKVKGIARTQSKGTYENYFKQIMAKINNLRKETSLDGASKTVKAKQTATFVDNNNIISNYKIISSKGAKASISGNKLTVTPDGSVTKVKINLKKIAPKGYQTGICLVWSNGSNKQRIGKLDGQWDPERISVTLNVLPATGDLHVTKTDITGTKELAGAKLKVTDKDGKTVDEWTSTKDVHIIKNLNSGEKYILTEVSAPEGYKVADSITFTMNADGTVTKVVMKDERQTGDLHITKTDITGTKEVVGAKLKVTDKDGKTVDEWTSDGKTHVIKGLLSGEKYTLTEVSAPKGYKVAASITFTMNADGSVTKVVMKDERILTNIQVNKIDSMTKQVIKSKDFKFGIYSDEACTKLIKEVSAEQANGTATFKDVEYGTYYIKEIAAPTGYKLSSEVVKVVVDEKLENVGKTYSISYMNTPLPAAAGKVQTGDGTSIFGLITMLLASAYAIYRLIKSKKTSA